MGFPATGNSDAVPLNDTNTRYDVTAAITVGSTASAAMSSRNGTSNAKSTPVAGVLKMAATPAAAPATIRTFMGSSPRLRRPRRAAIDPTAAPR